MAKEVAATTATSYVLDPASDGWSIHGPFWDLRTGLPPAIEVGLDLKGRAVSASAVRKRAKQVRPQEAGVVLREPAESSSKVFFCPTERGSTSPVRST